MSHEDAGYRAVKLKVRPKSETYHELYVQEYHPKKNSTIASTTNAASIPIGKTMFILNIPPYVEEEHLKCIYQEAGEITAVHIADRQGILLQPKFPNEKICKFFNPPPTINSFKTAYIVFKTTKSLRAALEINELRLYTICATTGKTKSILVTGLAKYERDYWDKCKISNEREIEQEVLEYMKMFDLVEEEKRVEEKEATNMAVDDDGWQTVKRGGGRSGGFEQKESVLKKMETKMEEGKKRKEHLNFYTFQLRETKKQHFVQLRRRFENDKQKIETMKKVRRFKPM